MTKLVVIRRGLSGVIVHALMWSIMALSSRHGLHVMLLLLASRTPRALCVHRTSSHAVVMHTLAQEPECDTVQDPAFSMSIRVCIK